MSSLLQLKVFCNRNNEEAGLPGIPTRRLAFQLPRPLEAKESNMGNFVDPQIAGVSLEFAGITDAVAARFGGGKKYVISIAEDTDT